MFPPQSPSLRSVGSFNNLKKGNRFGTTSTTTTRSSSPIRSVSSHSDGQYHHSIKSRIIRNNPNSNQQTHEAYTGKIIVAIRPKPISNNEKKVWNIVDNKRIAHDDVGEFRLDRIFDCDVSNLEIYSELCKPLIDKLAMGYNATLFAYGMTGSGKTFTMSGTQEDTGLIPLSISHLFNTINEENLLGKKKYEMLVSYMEIYNEKLYDLLDTNVEGVNFGYSSNLQTPPRFGNSFNSAQDLRIRDDAQYGIKVVGLSEHRCSSKDDLMKWVRIGDKNKKISETEYNSRSSRSHSILLVRLIATDLETGIVTTSTLSLCDLAGSEKATSQQERRKEGAFINKSLLALGTVIAKLSSESNQHRNADNVNHQETSNPNNSHIPYRDSKLTRILQPALSGNSIITTICTVDIRSDASSETLNTLRFASRAKNVSLHVTKKQNVSKDEEKDKLIFTLIQQLEEQKKLIDDMNVNKMSGNVLNFEKHAVPFANEMVANANSGPNNNIDTSRTEKSNIVDPSYALLESENKVLKFKLEHCENLLDKDIVELQDRQMINIVEMLPDGVGTLLEMKFQGLESQIRQYKLYTANLEKRLASNKNDENRHNSGSNMVIPINSAQGSRIASNNSDISMADNCSEEDPYDIIRHKEEEIKELKKGLERKDKMIEALQSARRLRHRALKPLAEANLLYENEQENRGFNNLER
ncbi:hypothetical protein TPHA_0D01270 [Tetrapisispora phaffii CBS 4417]|uniref:Kinesin-like protein n=1 Tax=Tetrapisispora phaffii (strain ATCC 24235 / CBS 4417 / NBRC 1672 / NRRL Y-8282 / UCD 70-5) TaxID=1071381 RepID=G8BSE7_TETPH|nr:hypothetical protein TPHA_0D01270 [Tetrapisispora phaffii CBS 4417]CCE62768.1 hypothetical protein TPHA_0D01270 [Tetrapisispora phaffii CBS 4417]